MSDIPREHHDAAELFSALSSALRVSILVELFDGPLAVQELVERLGASQPLISQHLKVLRGACLVHSERVGRQQRYHICDEHVTHIVQDAIIHTKEEH